MDNVVDIQKKKGSKPEPVAFPGGGELAPPPLASSEIVFSVPIEDVDESPTNPRTVFRGIDELAANVKLHGVTQPGVARPSKVAGRFELVFGARRLRASRKAGLTHFPMMVRDLSDSVVLEMQLIENIQREDIHALEEADSYQKLRDVHGFTVEEIAAKVGKPPSTVLARLKFCSLIPEARKAFFDDKFNAGVALSLARIPHADQQKEALKQILDQIHFNGEVTARQAMEIVRRRFMLKLLDAPFDRHDAQLVAAAGSCAACPKRTGNQRELFADVAAKEDLCTDSKCWDAKKAATWEAKRAEAKKNGSKVLSDRESKKLFGWSGATVDARSGYVDLSDKTYDAKGKPHSNRTLMGKAAAVPLVIARDAEGGTRELVAVEDFKAATKAAGNAEVLARPSIGNRPEAAAEKARRAKEAKKREAFALELADIVAKAERKVPGETFWRTLASGLVRIVWSDTRGAVCRRRKLELESKSDSEKVLLAYIGTLTTGEATGLAVELVVTSGRGDATEGFKAFAELFKPGMGAPLRDARAQRLAEKKLAKSRKAKKR